MTGFVDIGADQYHADPSASPSLSSSVIKILCDSSPAHAFAAHPKLNPDYARKEEARFDIGNAAHALLLQGVHVAHIVHRDDWRTAAAQEEREMARAHGQVPLLKKDFDDVIRMCDAVAVQIEKVDASPVPLTGGKPEQTLLWEDDGVACRARFDWVHDDLSAVDDLKTTSRSANPLAWSRGPLFSSGCDTQAAFYLRGLRIALGVTDVEWRWIVVETAAPYALSVISPGPDVLELAEHKIDYAFAKWKACLASGEWPAYPLRVAYAQAPSWEGTRWLEREAFEEAAAL